MIKVVDNITIDFFKKKIRVYDEGSKIMLAKTKVYNVLADKISNQAASILKQDMLSIGGDVAVNADVVRYKTGTNSCLLIGTKKHFSLLLIKLKKQPFGLKDIAYRIEQAILNYENKKFSLKLCDNRKINFFNSDTKIMGILNLTPDSFFDGGKFFNNLDAAIDKVKKMIDEGVDIIDLGAESTRPGAKPIDSNEELSRLLPLMKKIRKITEIPISIDTYKSEVAKMCLNEGADIINDISSFAFDEKMVDIIRDYKCPIILMHMQNCPKNMQNDPKYKDVVDEIIDYLDEKIRFAEINGIDREKIIVDPGIGFGKTVEHNFEILRRIKEVRCLDRPILVGASRKSFIGHIFDETAENRLIGTLAVSSILIDKKVDILRVHDVKENRQVCKIVKSII